jgi:hypothetical protein
MIHPDLMPPQEARVFTSQDLATWVPDRWSLDDLRETSWPHGTRLQGAPMAVRGSFVVMFRPEYVQTRLFGRDLDRDPDRSEGGLNLSLRRTLDDTFAFGFIDDRAFILARGDTNAPTFTRVDDLTRPATEGTPVDGLAVCADRPVLLAFALVDEGALVAATTATDTDCSSPELAGPPGEVKVSHVSATGEVVPTNGIAFDGDVDDVQLTRRSSGAWLTVRDAATGTLAIHTVSNEGTVAHVVDVESDGGLGFATWGDGLAIVDRAYDAHLRLRLFEPDGAVVEDQVLPAVVARPEARPAILFSDDGSHVAVGSFDRISDDVLTDSTQLVLMRGDCDAGTRPGG